jgi:hypothetical protein
MAVNITARFGKKDSDRNGLPAILRELLERPTDMRMVVGIIRPKRTGHDYDADGEAFAAIKFVHIEPVLDEQDLAEVRQVLDRAYKTRTGVHMDAELPFGHGDDPDDLDDSDLAEDRGADQVPPAAFKAPPRRRASAHADNTDR